MSEAALKPLAPPKDLVVGGRPSDTLQPSLAAKVVVDANGCWIWQGTITEKGYGKVFVYAHRYIYQLAVGPIADSLAVDHLCKVRGCVNPAHLEAVTVSENNLRSPCVSTVNKAKTHCKSGHEFTPENTRWGRNGRRRFCRTCHRISDRKQRSKELDPVGAART